MLNISPNSIQGKINTQNFISFQKVNLPASNKMFTRFMITSFVIFLVFLFLPWRQNIQSKGYVTTLQPEQRPQTIHATIAGRIEKWYVREGEIVKKGDTIVFLSEIKSEYFDPDLVPRTQQQVVAKEGAIVSYNQKVGALETQIQSMELELTLKRQQLVNKIRQNELKITSDSIELERSKIDYDIAQARLKRNNELYQKGLKSLLDLEQYQLKVQETNAKQIAAENKFLTSNNELANARIELNNVENEYSQKIAKARSDQFSTLSDRYDAEASANKLRIESVNYKKRSDFYYITAPQDAYITKALKPGIGETVKEGDAIVSIVPEKLKLAVEWYISPIDLPLVELGEEVRFLFDGWPALVFSGWPGASYGTFKGKIVAIDNMISSNDKFRILVAPDESEKEWPSALRPGSGAQGIALLNKVPLWYEIWRQLNGFPPDFYEDTKEENLKLKAPIKSIK